MWVCGKRAPFLVSGKHPVIVPADTSWQGHVMCSHWEGLSFLLIFRRLRYLWRILPWAQDCIL